jgi:hypothetical protein
MISEKKYIPIKMINLENSIFYYSKNIISELLFEIYNDRKNNRFAARGIIEIRNKINIRELIEPRRQIIVISAKFRFRKANLYYI